MLCMLPRTWEIADLTLDEPGCKISWAGRRTCGSKMRLHRRELQRKHRSTMPATSGAAAGAAGAAAAFAAVADDSPLPSPPPPGGCTLCFATAGRRLRHVRDLQASFDEAGGQARTSQMPGPKQSRADPRRRQTVQSAGTESTAGVGPFGGRHKAPAHRNRRKWSTTQRARTLCQTQVWRRGGWARAAARAGARPGRAAGAPRPPSTLRLIGGPQRTKSCPQLPETNKLTNGTRRAGCVPPPRGGRVARRVRLALSRRAPPPRLRRGPLGARPARRAPRGGRAAGVAGADAGPGPHLHCAFPAHLDGAD